MAMIKGHHFPGGKSVMPSKSVPQVASAPPGNKSGMSVDIRPIDNGYLIEKRTWSETKKGGYQSETRTVFSATKPKIEV